MEIVAWKSLRLLLLPWFVFHLYIYAKYSYFIEVPDLVQAVRSMISSLALIGCIFYALGIRCLTRSFWQVFYAVLVIDEAIGIYEASGYDVETTVFTIPTYIVLALYTFQNKSIWLQGEVTKVKEEI